MHLLQKARVERVCGVAEQEEPAGRGHGAVDRRRVHAVGSAKLHEGAERIRVGHSGPRQLRGRLVGGARAGPGGAGGGLHENDRGDDDSKPPEPATHVFAPAGPHIGATAVER